MTKPADLRRMLGPAAVVLLAVLLFSGSAFSQSCALCYSQAASSGNRMIHALQNGILILVIPPMFLSIGVTVLAYRKRNQFRDGSLSDGGDFDDAPDLQETDVQNLSRFHSSTGRDR